MGPSISHLGYFDCPKCTFSTQSCQTFYAISLDIIITPIYLNRLMHGRYFKESSWKALALVYEIIPYLLSYYTANTECMMLWSVCKNYHFKMLFQRMARYRMMGTSGHSLVWIKHELHRFFQIGPFAASFSLLVFFSTVNSKHMFYIKCCWGLDSNWRPLVPEATTFPIEQDCIAQYQVTLSQVKCYINEKEKIKFLKYFGLFNKVKTSRNEKCEFLQKENIFENLLLLTELFWGVAKICLLLPNSMLQRPSSAFEMGILFIFTLTVRLK